MTLPPHAWIWLAGFAASLAAVHLCAAWRDAAADEVDFDRPVLRSLTNLLAWGGFALSAIFAVTLDGVLAPLLAAAALWTAFFILRGAGAFRRLRAAAPALAAAGFVAALSLFQGVFGDSDFGLFSVFPPE